jgi:hypothetical protein
VEGGCEEDGRWGGALGRQDDTKTVMGRLCSVERHIWMYKKKIAFDFSTFSYNVVHEGKVGRK